MLVKLWSSALHGIEAKPIRIEVAIHQGIGYHMVAFRQRDTRVLASDRNRAKTRYAGRRSLLILHQQILEKKGDLCIALGILGASGQIDIELYAVLDFR